MYRRHFRARYRIYRKRVRDFVVYKILHADDPPYKLAMGVAVGIWVTFTPTIGLQMMLAVAIAWLLRANMVVGVPIVWISNPVTMVPIYLPCYWLGMVLLGKDTTGIRSDLSRLAEPQDGWWATVQHWLDVSAAMGLEALGPLVLGCLIVATALAIPSYFITYRAVVRHREHKRRAAEAAEAASHAATPSTDAPASATSTQADAPTSHRVSQSISEPVKHHYERAG